MLASIKPEKISVNCVIGLSRFDGGLKGRLQARLPAPPRGREYALNGQSRPLLESLSRARPPTLRRARAGQ